MPSRIFASFHIYSSFFERSMTANIENHSKTGAFCNNKSPGFSIFYFICTFCTYVKLHHGLRTSFKIVSVFQSTPLHPSILPITRTEILIFFVSACLPNLLFLFFLSACLPHSLFRCLEPPSPFSFVLWRERKGRTVCEAILGPESWD